MTQEEKQLLLKDLCGRLPYGVKILYTGWDNDRGFEYQVVEELVGVDDNFIYTLWGGEKDKHSIKFSDFKPYLRPISSMSESEIEEHEKTFDLDYSIQGTPSDWLNAHYIDYRGLIGKGLALEAPEGMYNKEESEKGSEIPIPKTVDESISTLEKILSDDDREYLLKNGAISMHDSLGRWIRNEWGLWTDSELKNELKKKGFEHPDDMSNYVIEEFIKYWNNKL